jgi:hypothetical protein
MPASPGSANVLQGAFLQYGAPQTQPKVILFPINPDTICRTLSPAPIAVGGHGSGTATSAVTANPVEVIVLTIPLDASVALETSDNTALQYGLHPLLAALELLMYPPPQGPNYATVFVWGTNRVLTVRLTGLKIVERLFLSNLSPICASVEVTMTIDPNPNTKVLPGVPEHLESLVTLASMAYAPGIGGTGLVAS